jgi:hypothetical protein
MKCHDLGSTKKQTRSVTEDAMKLFFGTVLLFATVQVQADGLSAAIPSHTQLIQTTAQSCLAKANGMQVMDVAASHFSVPVTLVNNSDVAVYVHSIEVDIVSATRSNGIRMTIASDALEAMGIISLAPHETFVATCPLIVGGLEVLDGNSYYADVSIYGLQELEDGEDLGVETKNRIDLLP